MTAEERADEEAYYRGALNTEALDWIASSEQLEAAAPPPNVPFVLLISTIAQCDSPDDVCGRTYGSTRRRCRPWPASGRRGATRTLTAATSSITRPMPER